MPPAPWLPLCCLPAPAVGAASLVSTARTQARRLQGCRPDTALQGAALSLARGGASAHIPKAHMCRRLVSSSLRQQQTDATRAHSLKRTALFPGEGQHTQDIRPPHWVPCVGMRSSSAAAWHCWEVAVAWEAPLAPTRMTPARGRSGWERNGRTNPDALHAWTGSAMLPRPPPRTRGALAAAHLRAGAAAAGGAGAGGGGGGAGGGEGCAGGLSRGIEGWRVQEVG